MQKPLHSLQSIGDVRGDGIQRARDNHLEYPDHYRDKKAEFGAIKNTSSPTPCAAPKYNSWYYQDHINGGHAGCAALGGRVASVPI